MTYEFIYTPGGLILRCEVVVDDMDAERAEDLGMKASHKFIRSSMNLTASPPVCWEESGRIDGCTQLETADFVTLVRISYAEFDAAYMRQLKALTVPGVN